MMHHEKWYDASIVSGGLGAEAIERFLEADPFFVPPILTKSSLAEEPLLRFLWSCAFDVLAQARHVVFVGYSLPVTDMAAKYLFREAIDTENCSLRVVSRASGRGGRARIVNAYRDVFPRTSDLSFDFRGALAWAKELSRSSTGDQG